MARTPMSVQDALWLTMDRPNSLMVIDTVMWFLETPDWDAVEAVVQERLVTRFPVFGRRPVESDSGWMWEDDPDFDLADHIHRVRLPDSDSVDPLQEFIAAQRSVPFDKSRPLWSVYFIDNATFPTGDHGAVVMGRFHHAIADGVRLVQVTLGMCDQAPSAGPTRVGKKLRRSTTPSAVAASAAKNVGRGFTDVARSTLGTASSVIGEAATTAQTAVSGDVTGAAAKAVSDSGNIFRQGLTMLRNPERITDLTRLVSSSDNRALNDVASVGKLALAGSSVDTVWTGTPGVEKGASWAPIFELPKVKEIGKATGTTVNDVLLAAVSAALTRYLREHGDDKVDEVVWMIPVSIKPLDAELPKDLGNHFALVAFRMPLGIDDVYERLDEVHQRMERIKASDEALLTFGVQKGISQAPRPVATALTNFFANKAVGVLTNVPGPREPMTLAGTEVQGVMGWAPCSGDQPMTICIFTYNDRVAVGFGTDATLVPDGNLLGTIYRDEFDRMHSEVVGA